MPKVTREALGYIEPQADDNKEDFSQCGSCKHWLGDKRKCDEIPSLEGVDADDSCDYYAPHRGLTPEEAGFVKRRVQCHRCEHSESGGTHCGLYAELQIDPQIKPHACCNAQEPKSRNTKRIAQAMNGY